MCGDMNVCPTDLDIKTVYKSKNGEEFAMCTT